FGPIRHHLCMRFEKKYAQIKTFVTRCFRNVPLSIAIRNQQCKFVIINGIEYKPGYVIRIKTSEPSYDFHYGLVDCILMYEGHKIFLTTILEIKKFLKSLCAF
uniref:Uncharacterized protein n=1 Tax=Amphimedon queenslandica TaxID=400682 RepID=A0A1X7SWG1_AMPQE